MLPYTLSMLVIIILLLVGIRYILKKHFPTAYKASNKVAKLVYGYVMKLVKWLGWGRLVMILYIFFANIITMSVLRHFFRDFFETVGKLFIVWFPFMVILKLQRYLKERWKRRYELPGRRN